MKFTLKRKWTIFGVFKFESPAEFRTFCRHAVLKFFTCLLWLEPPKPFGSLKPEIANDFLHKRANGHRRQSVTQRIRWSFANYLKTIRTTSNFLMLGRQFVSSSTFYATCRGPLQCPSRLNLSSSKLRNLRGFSVFRLLSTVWSVDAARCLHKCIFLVE